MVLSRSAKPIAGARAVEWQGAGTGPWASEIDGADVVINLTGESVAQRWIPEVKARLIASRIDSTRALCGAIRDAAAPPKVFVLASAIGYYGDTGDTVVDESSPPADDFLARLCVDWEGALFEADLPATRKVALRVGFPLGPGGGAYDLLWKLTRLGLGSAVGSGRNWMPWIHIEDLADIFRWTVDSGFEGVVNGGGPSPVRMNEFMATMRKVAHRPWVPNVPVFMAKLGELVGSPPVELATQSSRVVSSVLPRSGFKYRFEDLESALRALQGAT